MVGGSQELLLVSNSEVSREEKVIKLRVSYGGSFYKVRAAKALYRSPLLLLCVPFLALYQHFGR